MSKFTFSKKEMLVELKIALHFKNPTIGEVLSGGVGVKVFDWFDDESLEESHSNHLNVSDEEFDAEADMEQIYIETLKAAYDYAARGEETGLILDGGANTPLGWTSAWVADLERSMLAALLNNNKPVDCQKLTTVLELTQARAVLDEECGDKGRFFTRPAHPQNTDCLSFREVALLAGIEERSVRNAASTKVLPTVSDKDRAYVPVHAARNWLMGKKGYVASQPKRGLADRDLLAKPFVNLVEWSFYLHDRKTALAIMDSELLAIVNRDDRANKTHDLNGFFPETEEEVAQTAALLCIDANVLGQRLEELRLSMRLKQIQRSLNLLAKESAK